MSSIFMSATTFQYERNLKKSERNIILIQIRFHLILCTIVVSKLSYVKVNRRMQVI